MDLNINFSKRYEVKIYNIYKIEDQKVYINFFGEPLTFIFRGPALIEDLEAMILNSLVRRGSSQVFISIDVENDIYVKSVGTTYSTRKTISGRRKENFFYIKSD